MKSHTTVWYHDNADDQGVINPCTCSSLDITDYARYNAPESNLCKERALCHASRML